MLKVPWMELIHWMLLKTRFKKKKSCGIVSNQSGKFELNFENKKKNWKKLAEKELNENLPDPLPAVLWDVQKQKLFVLNIKMNRMNEWRPSSSLQNIKHEKLSLSASSSLVPRVRLNNNVRQFCPFFFHANFKLNHLR